jgi:PAS domain S-box-containing protein
VETEHTTQEISRLRRCINDLASLLALPAMWTGQDCSRVISTLFAVLIRMLDLDFAYARIADPANGSAREWMQSGDNIDHHAEAKEVGRALEPYLAAELPTASFRVINPLTEGTASIAVFHLGVQDRVGVFVAASTRPEFPTEIERLLLQVATSQAAIALQEARRIEHREASVEIERTRTKAALQDSEERFRQMADSIPETIRLIIDSTPAHIHTALPDGYLDYLNKRWLEYMGVSLEDVEGWKWTAAIHPDDLEGILKKWRASLASGEPFLHEARVRRADGEYRWMLHRKVAQRDEHGQIVKWYGASVDIEDRKRAEEERRRSTFYLDEGQRLAHSGSWSFLPSGIFEYLSQELYHIFGFDPAKGMPTIADYLNIVHPEDREFVEETINRMVAEGIGCDVKKRIIPRSDGEVRVIRCVGTPVRENGVVTRFIGTLMDITDQERMTQELRRKEAYLADAQRLSQTGSFGWSVSSGEVFWSEETFRIFEYDRAAKPSAQLVLQRVHPEDKTLVQHVIDRARQDGKNFDLEHRLLMPDGSIKYLHVVAHGIRDELDQIEFVGAVTDITATKIAEQRIQQDERELRQLIDFVPQHILVARPDGTRLYANQGTLEYHGMTLEEVQAEDFFARVLHPDDLTKVLHERQRAISGEASWEAEARLLRKDGQYRWFLIRSNPLRNEQGDVIRRCITATDIEDRKQAEEKVQRENVALREEIDKASMFEEIVGSSAALRKVLLQVAKVAPTDSTVLITGETGTGKELVARAIHKRSARSVRAFVSVSCAAIPQSLIASELFGHEKGAFTGALQRRLGRFELAEGGTIFLDEIGDLPLDTQNTLLRVLQEREFERVGGTETIRANVRVIAATNSDLKVAMTRGAFRSDLFYRLNVFPIEIPSLRERKEDIPMLVEYFIDRYASKAGKKIRTINRSSLKVLQSYSWPGNIRELQNVIERAVIVCENETLVIDENWLSLNTVRTQPPGRPLSEELLAREKERIEAALAETGGRVSGPRGAAAKLGIPRSTLDSKIRSLKINTHRFRTV